MYSPPIQSPISPSVRRLSELVSLPMDFASFNTEIATQPRWPELSYSLTEEELEDSWFIYILGSSHLLDIPVSAISSGP